MSIPVIDLRGAEAPGGPRSAEVAAQLRAACTTSGFFYLTGHGVPDEQVRAQFELTQQLFDLPLARREALSVRHSPTMHGFETLGEQTLDADARPDVKESFYCGMQYDDDHPYVLAGYQTYGHNQWPSELPQAPEQCEAYIRTMLALCRRLMQLMAVSLGLDEHYFDGIDPNPMVTLRMVRYPAHPADADERTFGAGAHTDWGAITILAQDELGGLEVQMPDGQWVPATPLAGSFVINLGDMIPRWTNDLYRSNPHRVRNLHSGGKPRYSIPFFYDPDYLTRIEPLPGTVPEGTQPRHAPCTAGEHLRDMYLKTYGHKPETAAA